MCCLYTQSALQTQGKPGLEHDQAFGHLLFSLLPACQLCKSSVHDDGLWSQLTSHFVTY